MKTDYNDYIKTVGMKLKAMRSRLITPGQRDMEAIATHTGSRIVQACKNFYFAQDDSTFDPAESLMHGFSASPGFGDVSALATRGIEDITILTAIKSLMKYVAIERSMDGPQQAFSYQNLISMGANGGFTDGQTIISPFLPTPLTSQLDAPTSTLVGAAGSNVTVGPFAGPIVPGSIVITIAYATTSTVAVTGEMVGSDPKGDGNISWSVITPGSSTSPFSVTAGVPTVTVNYGAGTVKFSVIPSSYQASVQVTVDTTADSTGGTTVKAKPAFVTTTLIATAQNIILEGSLESNAYRNKMLQNQIDAGITYDMADVAFRQMVDLYVSYVDLLLVNAIISVGGVALASYQSGTYVAGDISTYSLATSFAPTKDDAVEKFYLDLNKQLMLNCGHGMTALLTGLDGANILANVKDRFIPNENFATQVDGMIGTYNRTPVIRHRLVDAYQVTLSQTSYDLFYAIFKTPNGKAGPIAFGEYIPLYATKQVLNYANPTQYAQALFSYIGTVQTATSCVAVGQLHHA